jgi:hypothetical protein
MPRKKASGFYRDEEGKTRPITSKNVGSALARGIVIKRVVSSEGEEIRKRAEGQESPDLERPPSGLFGPLDMAFLGLAGVKQDAEGYYIISTSDSTPGKEYKTVYWTESVGRFNPGDISCNCQGWIFSKKSPKSCKHTDKLHSLFYEAHNRYMQKGVKNLKPAPAPVFFTRVRKDPKTSKTYAKFEKVFPNHKEMGESVELNDGNDVALVLDPHTVTLCTNVFKGQVDTSYFEETPQTIMEGNLGVSGALAKSVLPSDVDVLILPRNTMIAKSKLRDILKVLGWTKIYIF